MQGNLEISGGSGGGDVSQAELDAVADAQFIVAAADGDLTAERVATDTATVAWDFGTAAQAKANVPDNAITDAKLRNSAGLSVIGRSINSTGDPADIVGVSNGQFLVIRSNSVGFDSITADDVDGMTTPKEETTTSTGTVNDYSLDDNYILLRCNNASDLTLTGFQVLGQTPSINSIVTIVSIGAGNVFLSHQNTGSTAANRLINFVTSAATPLAAGVGTATYIYDTTTDRWRLIAHDQGGFITPTFDANNYVAETAGTLTVAAGDVTTQAYLLEGKKLTVQMKLDTMTLSSSSTVTVSILNGAWGGFTFARDASWLGYMYDNGNTTAVMNQTAASTKISWTRLDGAVLTTATNLFYVRGTYSTDVT